jgi:hypothetical protein
MVKHRGEHATRSPTEGAGDVPNWLTGTSQFLKALALLALIGWVIYDKDFVKDWLYSLSGGELFGFKFEREAIDQATRDLEKLAAAGTDFDKLVGDKALTRAIRVAPAIVDSRILWADDGWSVPKPKYSAFNEQISAFLKRLRIAVDPVSSTDAAMKAMQISPYDIVISNVSRKGDPENQKEPLKLCRVHYFKLPHDQGTTPTRAAKNGVDGDLGTSLDEFNKKANEKSAAGFKR